jgi:hypothetical protein
MAGFDESSGQVSNGELGWVFVGGFHFATPGKIDRPE